MLNKLGRPWVCCRAVSRALRAVGRVRGLVDGVRTVAAQRLQQRLHRRAVAVLGGLAAGAFPFQRLAVFAQGLHRAPHDNAV